MNLFKEIMNPMLEFFEVVELSALRVAESIPLMGTGTSKFSLTISPAKNFLKSKGRGHKLRI
jgi:hypothetical protein